MGDDDALSSSDTERKLRELAEELKNHEARRGTAWRRGRSKGLNTAGERLEETLNECYSDTGTKSSGHGTAGETNGGETDG